MVLDLRRQAWLHDMSQVYKGRIIGGPEAGRSIAVKIVDPHMRVAVDSDLALMRATAAVLECIPRLHWISLCETVQEFAFLMEDQVCSVTLLF